MVSWANVKFGAKLNSLTFELVTGEGVTDVGAWNDCVVMILLSCVAVRGVVVGVVELT